MWQGVCYLVALLQHASTGSGAAGVLRVALPSGGVRFHATGSVAGKHGPHAVCAAWQRVAAAFLDCYLVALRGPGVLLVALMLHGSVTW